MLTQALGDQGVEPRAEYTFCAHVVCVVCCAVCLGEEALADPGGWASVLRVGARKGTEASLITSR